METIPVFEDRWYAIVLEDYDPAINYEVWIGDERLKLNVSTDAMTYTFEKGVYFESAFGSTELTLRAADKIHSPKTLFTIRLYVVPNKIGWNNYKSMVQDLQNVCRALVTDVRGKSSAAGTNVSLDSAFWTWRTADEELQAVCGVCRRLRPVLREIKSAPQVMMRLERRPVHTMRCTAPRAIADLMKRGHVPTVDDGMRTCAVGCFRETYDIAEHRLLKAFLKLLRQRLVNCSHGLQEEITRLESEKTYRSRRNRPDEISLYESEDVPRIRRFQERVAEAERVTDWIEGELGQDFWQGVREEIFVPESMQFAGNDYYLVAANIVLRYLRDLSHWGGTFGTRFITKKSSRMYEQWVLIHLVAAFTKVGLNLTSWDDVLRRSLSRHTRVDFLRNTTLCAAFTENTDVVIRYEPWIHSKNEIYKYPEETLYHAGLNSWSPDIVIELVQRKPVKKTLYAIALDAKYSRRPTQEMREKVSKYTRIRARAGVFGRRIMRQVWLVYPGNEGRSRAFWFDDEAMTFSAEQGVIYRDVKEAIEPTEQVTADLVVMPSSTKTDARDEMSAVGIQPKQSFVTFAQGTLAYFKSLLRTS